jgi:hypothetical protein
MASGVESDGRAVIPAAQPLGFSPVLTWAFDEQVLGPEASSLALDAGLAKLAGRVADEPCQMVTQSFRSTRWHRFTVASIALGEDASGEVVSATVIGLPACRPSLLLGIDLVALRGHLVIAALDALPLGVHAGLCDGAAAWLRGLRSELGDRVVDRKVPEFAQHASSDDAIIVGARRDSSSAALHFIGEWLPRLTPLLRTADTLGHEDAVDDRIRGELAERSNRKEQAAVARLFGESAARRYLDEVLLPYGYAAERAAERA